MDYRTNHVQATRARGGVAMGINVQMPSAENVEVVGATGYEFVVIDCEHGSFDLERATQLCRAADAAGTTPLVRVPDRNPAAIMRALDGGAMGVVVPAVTNRAEAHAAVLASKYKLAGCDGARGACPSTRATWHLSDDWLAFARWANENTMVWLLIESAAASANVDEILEVPGVSAIVPGPFDLAQDMGHPGDLTHPEVLGAVREMARKARAKNVDTVAVLLSSDQRALDDEVQFWRSVGATMYWAAGDRRLFTLAARQRRTQVQAALGSTLQR
jgi:4-hydroxy-2-oxoheptanedioate aldolase